MAASKGVDVAEVIALYEAGRSLHRIAEMFGVNHTTINYHLRREGVALRPNGTHELPISTKEILQLREQGWTYKQIGERVGVSPDTARRRVDRARIAR